MPLPTPFSLANSSTGGPDAPPQPWMFSGGFAISYDGSVLVPTNVIGGNTGAGTINANNYFIQGIPIAQAIAAGFLPLAGGTLTGPLIAPNVTIPTVAGFNLGGGIPDQVLATNGAGGLFWADVILSGVDYLPLTGGTLTGPLIAPDVTIADVSGLSVGGGLADQFLQTDGAGDLVWAAGPIGPEGPQGLPGPQGPAGEIGILIGFFENTDPADLPPDGALPPNFDGQGGPAYQMTQGQGLLNSNTATPTVGHIYVYVTAALDPIGWVDGGLIQGPEGPQGIQGIPGQDGLEGPQGPPGTPADLSEYVLKAGDTMTGTLSHLSGGINFGEQFAVDPTDCSNHISLYGPQDTAWGGFNTTNGRLNIFSGGATYFNFTGVDIALFDNTGFYLNGMQTINNPVGVDNCIFGQTSGSNRWCINLGDNNAESGGNNGRFLTIRRYSDIGVYIDTPFFIERTLGKS
ncbi:MAG TPA: hypothetical protein VK890_07975, partial [Bacteroidia bacterium]|nr:hypothetical protein [Bacteroidia bacterium]